jgi:hypothetical protein
MATTRKPSTRKPSTRKPSTRKPPTDKPRTNKPSTVITIVADEAVLLWDAMTDAVTAAKIRALLPDRIQLVARPRPAPSAPKPAVAVPNSAAVGRAAA